MEENIIDLDVNSIYGWCYREKKEMTLNFSIKYQKYSSVFGHLREVKQANDKLLECLGIIHNFCGVCRIFTNNYELVLDYEHDLIVSKMKLEIHSGSMLDEETLEREIRNMICFAPFDKYDMIWTLS